MPQFVPTWEQATGGGQESAMGGQKPQGADKSGAQGKTYWENPENVALHHTAQQIYPEQDWNQYGWDPDFVDWSFKYLKEQNGDKPWWEWEPLKADDPFLQNFKDAPAPPTENMWKRPIGDWSQEMAQPEQPEQPGGPGGGPTGVGEYWTQPNYEDLPAWQKVMSAVMGNQYFTGMIQAMPWSTIGAVGGFAAGGPIGAVAGFIGPQLAVAGINYASDPKHYEKMLAAGYDPEFVKGLQGFSEATLRALNFASEKLEQGAGLTGMFGNAALQDMYFKNGALARLIDNYPKVAEASRLSYEAVFGTGAEMLPGVQAPNIGNAPAAIEMLVDKLQSGDAPLWWNALGPLGSMAYMLERMKTGTTDARLSKPGEVWVLGQREPVMIDKVGIEILDAALSEMIAGKPSQQVIDEWQRRLEFSGQFADMMAQNGADPLNVIPFFERKGVIQVSKWVGDPALELAARSAVGEGAVGTMRVYSELLRSGEAFKLDAQGNKIKLLPQDMSKLQIKLGGLTPTGEIKELTPKGRVTRAALTFMEQPFNPLAWAQSLKELTPGSKYRALAGISQENLGVLLNQAQNDPHEMIKLVKAMAELPPTEASKIAMQLGTPEMITVRQGMEGAGLIADEMGKLWDLANRPRTILDNISEVLGEEPGKTLEYLRGNDKDLLNVYQRIKAKAAEQGKQGLLGSDFTADGLSEMVQVFDETWWARTPEAFQAVLHNRLMDSMDKWMVKNFGVTPDSKLTRFFSGLKSIQSLVVLGFNGRYLINNGVSNVVTRAAEGIFGFYSKSEIDSFFKEFGIEPHRLRAGVGAADVGLDITAKGKAETLEQAFEQKGLMGAEELTRLQSEVALRKATRAKDALQGFQDVAAGVSRLGIMSKLAQANERSESANVMYVATKQAWSRLWQREGLIPKMPGDLRQALERIDPRLPDAIMAAVEQAKNHGALDMIRGVEQRLAQSSADAYLAEAAAELKIPLGDLKEAIDPVIEQINQKLAEGQTIAQAFGNVAEMLDNTLDRKLARNLEERAAEVEVKVKSSGFVAGMDIFKDIQLKTEELWTRHFAEWERTFELASVALDKAEYNALIKAREREARAEWDRHQLWVESTYDGVLRALGFGDPGDPGRLNPTAQEFAKGMIDLHQSWKEYFVERSKLYDEHFSRMEGITDKKVRIDNWHELQLKLSEMYDEYVVKENRFNLKMGAAFVEMWAAHFGPERAVGAAEWWKNAADLAVHRQQLMSDFRAWERGDAGSMKMPEVIAFVGHTHPSAKHAMWPEFLRKLYLPTIAEWVRSGLDGATKMYEDVNKAAEQEAAPGEAEHREAVLKYFDESLQKLREEGYRPGEADVNQPEPRKLDANIYQDAERVMLGLGKIEDYTEGAQNALGNLIEDLIEQVKDNRGPKSWLDQWRPAVEQYLKTQAEQQPGIPVMMTGEMRRKLRDLGWYRDEIAAMKPEEAWQIINEGRRGPTTLEEERVATQKATDIENKNAGLSGPRNTLGERMNLPDKFAEILSEQIAWTAGQMLEILPPGDQSIVVIETDEGGFRQSQNPTWYTELYNRYEKYGKSLSKDTVINALQRIIDDKGKDKIGLNEQTIEDVKDIVFRMMDKFDPDSAINYYGLDTIESLLASGDVDRAAEVYDKWYKSYYGDLFEEADWIKLTGSKENWLNVVDHWVEMNQRLTEPEPAPVEMDVHIGPEVETFKTTVDVEHEMNGMEERGQEFREANTSQVDVTDEGVEMRPADPAPEKMYDLSKPEERIRLMVEEYHMPEEQAARAYEIENLLAEVWAKRHGRTEEEYWKGYRARKGRAADLPEGENEIRLSALTVRSLDRRLINQAKALGVTDNLQKSGFVDADGELLDLSQGLKHRVDVHADYLTEVYKIYDPAMEDQLDYLSDNAIVTKFLYETRAVRISTVDTWTRPGTLILGLELADRINSKQVAGIAIGVAKLGVDNIDLQYEFGAGGGYKQGRKIVRASEITDALEAINTERGGIMYQRMVAVGERRRAPFQSMRAEIDRLNQQLGIAEQRVEQLQRSKITGLRITGEFQAEVDAAPIKAAIDLAGLTEMNKYGHEAGDVLLKTFAEAMNELGLNAYHDHGDEFTVLFDNRADAEANMIELHDLMLGKVIPVVKDGKPIHLTGFDFRHGIGETMEAADLAQIARKEYLNANEGWVDKALPPSVHEVTELRRGAFDSANKMIYALENRDADTWLHEGLHLYLDHLDEGERAEFLGHFNGDEEDAANGYVQWRTIGEAPNSRIREIWNGFREFMVKVLDKLREQFGLEPTWPHKGMDDEQIATFERMYKLDAWEMTFEEYLKDTVDEGRQWVNGTFLKVEHGKAILEAMRAGKRVPERVLENYPGIREMIAKEQTHTGAPVSLETAANTGDVPLTPPPPRPAGQGEMFPSGEELPIFSGTAQRGAEETFTPKVIETQGEFLGMEKPKPEMAGAKEGGEVAGPLFEQPPNEQLIKVLRIGDTFEQGGRSFTLKEIQPSGYAVFTDNTPGYPISRLMDVDALRRIGYELEQPTAPEANVTNVTNLPRSVAPDTQQNGVPAKKVARLLDVHGLSESVVKPEFYMRIENEPYLPLVIESHMLPDGSGLGLYFTHYVEQGGDWMIDTEMIYRVDQYGMMEPYEYAYRGPAGEVRVPAREYMRGFNLFANDLIQNGFTRGKLVDPRAQEAVALPREQQLMGAVFEQIVSLKMPWNKQKDYEDFAKDFGFDPSNMDDLDLMYDVFEGALNMRAREIRADLEARNAPLIERIQAMVNLEGQLTKARRTIGKSELQQFSTPLPIAEAAAWAADVRPGDVVGEPTAGTANLVDMFYGRKDVAVRVNEIDPGRQAVLRALGYEPSGMDVISAKWLMENGVKAGPWANVIIMNPPWGAYSTGKYGKPVNLPVAMNDWSQRFTHLIMERVPEGGRVVIVAPTNWVYTMDRRTREITPKRSLYLKWLEEHYQVKAIIESPPGAYDTRATGVGSLLIVVDKVPRGTQKLHFIERWGDTAPESWENYEYAVNMLKQNHGLARDASDSEVISRSQEAVRYERPVTEQPRPISGPDATGLADPAARRGEPRGDPADIGKLPTAQPVTRPGAGAAEPGGARGEPSLTGEPGLTPSGARLTPTAKPIQPGLFPTEAGAGRLGAGQEPVGAAQAGGIEQAGGSVGVPGHPGGGVEYGAGERLGGGANVEAAPGEARDIGAGLVEGQPAEVRQPVPGPVAPTLTRAFTENLQRSIDAVADSRNFALYVGRSPLVAGDEATPHPVAVVETKALSGVPYPDLLPEHRPTKSVMDALNRRVISVEGNLDPVWAAIQQNDKYHMGMLVADDVGMGKSRTGAAFVLDRLERGAKRILVITSGNGNVRNLMNTEYPGVYAGTVDEYGGWKDVPNLYPAERVLIDGDNTPEAKDADSGLPVFDKPAVYFIADHLLLNYYKAIDALKVDAVVVDEAHKFKNPDTKKGAAWYFLHKDFNQRLVDTLYLSATPGVDISDLSYLYGLRIWTIDGFNDWIKIITGEESAQQVKKRQAATSKLDGYVEKLAQAAEAVQKTEHSRKMRYWAEPVKGYMVGDLFVYKDNQSYSKNFTIHDTKGGEYDVVTTSPNSLTEAIIVADLINKNGGDVRAAYDQYRDQYPRPDNAEIHTAGAKDLSDLQTKTLDKGKTSWGKAKKTAFESTIKPEHTEQIMRELKLSGSYLSRDIGRSGVEFDVKKYELPAIKRAALDKRIDLYRQIKEAWQTFKPMNQGPDARAAAAFGINGDLQGDSKRSQFNARLSGAIEETRAALARGEQVVIGLESVSEVLEGGKWLENAISKINTLMVKKEGDGQYSDPEEIPEALMEVARLREQLTALGDMPSPIEVLKNEFGDKIGFIIGEVKDVERERINKRFQSNQLDVVVISGAGKTGINLHDVTGKRRVHLIMADYEWSATTFKQALGRVDRTGQRSSPKVTVLHMGMAGERKFISTIANRMKGLGAICKGEAASTGTGALTEVFELGGLVDRMAMAKTWDQLTVTERGWFMDKYFNEPKTPDMQRTSLPTSFDALKKFLMAFQSMPVEVGNKIYDLFDANRLGYIGSEAYAEEQAQKVAHNQGKIMRETKLNDTMTLTEVENAAGDKFAVVNGVLTPEMNQLRQLIEPNYMSNIIDEGGVSGSWMRWSQFYDAEQNKYVSGLVVKPSRIKKVAEAYGQQAGGGWKPETALRDLQSGDTIPLHGAGNSEWELYVGHSGFRADKIVVKDAKMADKNALMTNGARYDARGNFFYVPEDDLQTFLKRFPIRQGGKSEPPRIMYQSVIVPGEEGPKAMPMPSEEAANAAGAFAPGDFSAMRLPRAITINMGGQDWRVVGFVFEGRKFVAYVPEKFAYLKEFDTKAGKARLLGFDPQGNWVFEVGGEKRTQPMSGTPGMEATDTPAMGPMALGAMDGTTPQYDSQFSEDGYKTFAKPAVDYIQRRMQEDSRQGGIKGMAEADTGTDQMYRQWIGKVKQEIGPAKLAAIRLGERKRDMSLYNYSRRYGQDNTSQAIYPYMFWPSRAMFEWSMRFMDRPAWLSWMARYAQMAQDMQDDDKNMPSRLRGRIRMPVRWLPEWAGGALFIDPMSKAIPMNEFTQPVTQFMTQQTRSARVAEQLLQEWSRKGQITAEEAEAAIASQSGAAWERAMTQANQEEGSGDVLDYMQLFTNPAMYLTVPYQLAKGKGKQISVLPGSRLLQGLAAVTGMDWIANLDLEAKARQKAGMSQFGQFGDYYVDRQLSNMVADGVISYRESVLAMIEKTGPAYEQALERVKLEMAMKEPGMGAIYAARQGASVAEVMKAGVLGLFSGGLFPAGELELRGLADEYSAAWKAYRAGDQQALKSFFLDHPEYEARLALYDKPEERMKQFLISEVWERYTQMDDLYKKQAREQLGQVFLEQFLSEETRDYDSLSPETLASWATSMGGYAPGALKNIPGQELQLAEQPVADIYQQYHDQMSSRFPGIGEVLDEYFQATPEQQEQLKKLHPEIDRYYAWRDRYMAQHPEVIEFVTGEENKLAGLPMETAQAVYAYRAERQQFGANIFAVQDEFFTLSSSKEKSYFKKLHPELEAYWDWQKEYLAWHPEIIPWVKSSESVALGVLGKDYKQKYGVIDPATWPEEIQMQLAMYAGFGEQLTPGIRQWLEVEWEKAGEPFGTFEAWLKAITRK